MDWGCSCCCCLCVVWSGWGVGLLCWVWCLLLYYWVGFWVVVGVVGWIVLLRCLVMWRLWYGLVCVCVGLVDVWIGCVCGVRLVVLWLELLWWVKWGVVLWCGIFFVWRC